MSFCIEGEIITNDLWNSIIQNQYYLLVVTEVPVEA